MKKPDQSGILATSTGLLQVKFSGLDGELKKESDTLFWQTTFAAHTNVAL